MKKTIFAVLLVACFVSVAVAAEANKNNSVARPGVVSGGTVEAHPFIDVAAIQATGTKIFVSDAADNVVNIYNTKGKLLGQLTGFSQPQGLATDGKGNLYVADTSNSQIQVFAPPYTGSSKKWSDPGQYPAGVAVSYDGKYLAVTNIITTAGGPGSVTLYKHGKAGPTISNTDFARAYFCAFDDHGSLFVDGSNSSGVVEIGEIAHLTNGGKKWKTLTYSQSISFPGGVQVTTGDTIAIDDQLGPSVYTFKPPVGGSLGSPIATTPLTGSSDPVTFAFTKNNKDLWTADAGLASSNEFAYPAGGSPVATISVGGQPIGVAIVPVQQP